MEKVDIHLKRLRRHYDHSVNTYDDASLLDLSHVLRIWAELKTPLQEVNDKFRTSLSFRSESPVRKLLRTLNQHEYVFSYFPGGVVTNAHKGKVLSVPKRFYEGAAGSKIKKDFNPGTFLYFYFTAPQLDQEYWKLIENTKTTRCNYANWLGAEAVRLCYKNKADQLENVHISREVIIKRLANTMDGSHPSLGKDENDESKFDEPIKFLREFECGGLPLPYFILLKIAQDILRNVPILLEAKA